MAADESVWSGVSELIEIHFQLVCLYLYCRLFQSFKEMIYCFRVYLSRTRIYHLASNKINHGGKNWRENADNRNIATRAFVFRESAAPARLWSIKIKTTQTKSSLSFLTFFKLHLVLYSRHFEFFSASRFFSSLAIYLRKRFRHINRNIYHRPLLTRTDLQYHMPPFLVFSNKLAIHFGCFSTVESK